VPRAREGWVVEAEKQALWKVESVAIYEYSCPCRPLGSGGCKRSLDTSDSHEC
jgi:hypothetical protein